MKNIIKLSLIFALFPLASCKENKTPVVYSFNSNEAFIMSNSGDVRVVNAEFIPVFNTTIQCSAYFYEGDYTEEQLKELKSDVLDSFVYYHALTDRHYSYTLHTASGDTLVNNVKTINEKYATGEAVKVDPYLFDLLKSSYDFTINSGGKFNMFTGSLSDLYEDKLNEYSYQNREDAYLTEATGRRFSSFSASEREELEEIQLSTPQTKDDFEGLLTFDKENSTVTFNKFANDNGNRIQISLGGNGKGYATETIADAVEEKYPGICFLVNSGASSIKTVGKRPDSESFRIRYSNPIYQELVNSRYGSLYNSNEIYLLSDEAFNLSTSGYYQQYFYEKQGEKYLRRDHIIDATTGYSSAFFDQVSVYLNDAGLADMYTTALTNTYSVEEALSLFSSLNEIYDQTDSGIILTYKSLKDDKDKFFSYSPADFDKLNEEGNPCLLLEGGEIYTEPYDSLTDEKVIGIASEFKPEFQETYLVSSSLMERVSIMPDLEATCLAKLYEIQI